MDNAVRISELQFHSSLEKERDFAAMLHALILPGAFPFAPPNDTPAVRHPNACFSGLDNS